MAKSKGKTISGAMDSFPNLEHNTREHIPPNSEESRRNRNVIYSHDINVTIEQVYEKVFQAHYEEWREREIKKGRGKLELLMHCFIGRAKKCDLVLSQEVDSAEWTPAEEVVNTIFPEAPGNAAFAMYKKFMRKR